MYIDTHTHLDLDQFPDVDSVIESAASVGVHGIINIGFGPERWKTTLGLVDRFPQVACTLGFHPGESDQFNPDTGDQLVALLDQNLAVGIGEAGIDLYWENNPAIAVQREAFAFQIDLALRFELPLVIHQRSAEPEVAEQLEAADRDLRVILHSFDGTERLFRLVLDRNWFLGAGGLMTRRSAPVRELLKVAPLDRLLLETDSPFLVPAGIKQRRNEPSNIPVIAERLAGLRGVDSSVIQQAAWENTFKAFPRLSEVSIGMAQQA